MSQVEQKNSKLIIRGPLGFNTVMQVYKASRVYWAAGEVITQVDLTEVGQADSAALALFCEWVALAKQRQQTLSFINSPQQLLHLAKVSGVGELLGLVTG